jgi:Flp pilus assembly protein protease CpaA
MLELALFSVALVILLIATYTDIKTREVPDWLNFAGIAAGIGIRLLWSLETGEWAVLGLGVLGFALLFVLGCIMYYAGQWGGGDSKLLMALGAIVGLEFSFTGALLSFILWSLLAGAAYGLCWSVALAAKNRNQFARKYRALSQAYKWAHAPAWLALVLGFAFAIASNDELFRILMLVVGLSVPVLFYLALLVKAVEHCCMYREYPVGRLTEGDWIAKPVSVKGKYICGPKDLGVSAKHIAELKKLRVKSVLVKEGIPFVPSFLLGFLLTLLLGSPIAWMF